MRILILTQWYLPEPQELLSELAETLQELGHEVTVLTGYPNWPAGKLYSGYQLRLYQKEKINGVPIIRVPLYPYHGRSSVKRIANFLSFATSLTILGPWLIPPVDVIHVVHPPLTVGWAAWIISRLYRIPFTYDVLDMWPETLRATGMINNKYVLEIVAQFAKWVYGKAAAIRVVSPGFRANLIEKGVPPEKICFISNWVDTNFFRPVKPENALALQLGLSERFNIMFAGTIGLAQGLDTVLDAAILLRDIPKVQFVLVGDGADCQRLQVMAAERQIHNILFLGRHPATEMPRLYALADVLFLHLKNDPLFRITIPHKIFTYLASGLPILAAIEGDAAEVVCGAQAGVVCKSGDPKGIADAVRKLYLLSPAERTSLGMNGRRAAVELYTRENLVSQIEQMIVVASQNHKSKR